MSAAADLQSCLRERHVNETGVDILTVSVERLFDAGGSLRVFSHHVEIAATTRAGQFLA